MWYNIERMKPKTISGKKYLSIPRVCVYAWTRGKQWLYVGQSDNVYVRILRHPVINTSEPVLETDKITLWPCISVSEARKLEREFIVERRPKYNREHFGPHRRSQHLQFVPATNV